MAAISITNRGASNISPNQSDVGQGSPAADLLSRFAIRFRLFSAFENEKTYARKSGNDAITTNTKLEAIHLFDRILQHEQGINKRDYSHERHHSERWWSQ